MVRPGGWRTPPSNTHDPVGAPCRQGRQGPLRSAGLHPGARRVQTSASARAARDRTCVTVSVAPSAPRTRRARRARPPGAPGATRTATVAVMAPPCRRFWGLRRCGRVQGGLLGLLRGHEGSDPALGDLQAFSGRQWAASTRAPGEAGVGRLSPRHVLAGRSAHSLRHLWRGRGWTVVMEVEA